MYPAIKKESIMYTQIPEKPVKMPLDVSFIEDLPKGPLDHYREQATFNWKQMRVVLEEPRKLKLKMEIWDTLKRDPLFQINGNEETTEKLKRITQLQIKKFLKYKYLQNLEKLTYVEKMSLLMTVNEALIIFLPNLSVKLALGFSLISNTLLGMGTETHRDVYKAVLSGKIFAGIALTEVAHGSNTKEMQTTAVYDPKTQEFVINTPNFESAKSYVGNLGKTCTVILLGAQLYTEGECRGLHVFVVPVRDPKTLLPYPGLVVGDIGEKAGLHGIDNGFIMFNNYRVPRECLLNRTANVTPDGTYENCFSDPARILSATLEMLSAARVGIIQENSVILGNAVTIAVRYAALRKQFGEKNNETPILEYPLHQWRLFPYVSACVVHKLFTTYFTHVYLRTVDISNSGVKLDNLSEMASEIHAIVSCAKPIMTWTCRDAIQECREACGAYGYLKAAKLGEMRNDQDPSVTYEGDNNVLVQQTSNWLLRNWVTAQVDKEMISPPFETCTFFNNGHFILNRRFQPKNIEEVEDIKFIFDTYEWLICWFTSETHNMLQTYLKDTCKFNARNNVQVYRARELSRVYFENMALRFYWNEIFKNDVDYPVLTVLQQLGVLYGLWSIDKYLIYLYQGGYTSGPNLSKFVKEAILKLCALLKPNAVAIIDSLAPPDFALNSIIGSADGKLYESIQKEFFHKEGNLSRPNWWKDIVDEDAPDMLSLLKSKL